MIREAEKKNQKIIAMSEMEQKVLRSQMNPHFIFNVLNSIQGYILEHNSEEAVRFLGKFSQLIRKVLQHSKSATISLADELSALNLYLQLEEYRLSQGLNYEITIDAAINPLETAIPPIIFQPIVENAIWHGIAPAKKKGEIRISISKVENHLVCIIEDNGIGIEASKSRSSSHESMGLQNITERLLHFSHQNGFNPELKLSNKIEGNGACLRFTIPHIAILADEHR